MILNKGIWPAIGHNLCVEVLVPPVLDSAVDLCTARSGNTGSTGGNSPILQDRRTNQSIAPNHRASLATGAARVRISDINSYLY